MKTPEIDVGAVEQMRIALGDALCALQPAGLVTERVIAVIQLACSAVSALPGDKTHNVTWGIQCFLTALQDVSDGSCVIQLEMDVDEEKEEDVH